MDQIIGQGELAGGIPYTIGQLTMEELPKIARLQEEVVRANGRGKETLQPLPMEEYRYVLEGNGLLLGVYAENQLVGLRALMVPYKKEGHLGLDAGLPKEELDKVIYQDITMVHPAYRGNRLQQKLAVLIMEELAKREHRFTYVCSTVAPNNIPSLKDKFVQGMEIAALKKKYGGYWRYIFIKGITEPTEKTWTSIRSAPMSDFATQQQYLEEGFRGFAIEQTEDGYRVIYGKAQA